MTRFRVYLRGENFLLNIDGEHGKFSFSAIRIVKSKTKKDAERIALIRLHHELNRIEQIVKNIPDTPRLYSEQIEALKFFQFVRKKNCQGITFIKEDSL